LISFLSSSLFFVNYITWPSCQVVNSRDFEVYGKLLAITDKLQQQLFLLGIKLQEDYQKIVIQKSVNIPKKAESLQEKQHFSLNTPSQSLTKSTKFLLSITDLQIKNLTSLSTMPSSIVWVMN
jgi:hypothetical protein